MRRAAALILVCMFGGLTAAELIGHLGGSGGFGEGVVPRNDDEYVSIDLTPIWPTGLRYYGTTYTSVWLNNNGNLTFESGSPTFTPGYITAAASNPIIAAWYADVDTREVPAEATGQYYDGISRPNLIYYDLDTVNGIFTVTWDYVGYFNQHADKLNAFQIRLMKVGTGQEFDFEMRYRQLQWTTGDASGGSGGLGGTVVRAGYSAGNGISYFEFPQSGNQSQMLALARTVGNTGETGIWRWQVRKPNVAITPTLAYSNAGLITFTLTMPADATGFDAGDVVVTGGTAGSLSGPTASGGNLVYTLPVTTASGTLQVTVPAGRLTSPFGDQNDQNQQTVIIDFNPPAQPGVPTVTVGSPTVISGTTEPFATVQILLDGIQRATVTADALGDWTWQPPGRLASGTFALSVVAVDRAGNVSAVSASTPFTHTQSSSGSSGGDSGGCGGGLAGLLIALGLLAMGRLRRS